MAEGVSDLGNLGEDKNGKKIFTHGGQVIDISDSALSLVEELTDSLEIWLDSKSSRGKELTNVSSSALEGQPS